MNIFTEIADRKGGQAKVCRLLGVSTSAYSNWTLGHRRPDIENCKKIEKMFKVSRKKLRPDLYSKD
jgi:DNA-binding transcriptional regulator YdaS (Cro superfamily)